VGYSGLEHWQSVDGASDLHYWLTKSVGTQSFSSCVNEALKEEGNAYNPSGGVNLALIIESGDFSPSDFGKRALYSILDNLISLLEENNDDYHDKAYLRLYHVVKKSVGGL